MCQLFGSDIIIFIFFFYKCHIEIILLFTDQTPQTKGYECFKLKACIN